MPAYKTPRLNLTGRKFGKLQVIGFSHMAKKSRSMWRCKCDCGAQKVIAGSNLVRGISKSCGCVAVARFWRHGFGREKLRDVWLNMKYACENPTSKAYRYYGGKGISLCAEWQDYTHFREWSLRSGFKSRLVLGRIDFAGNYEPGNCRWVARAENMRASRAWRKRHGFPPPRRAA